MSIINTEDLALSWLSGYQKAATTSKQTKKQSSNYPKYGFESLGFSVFLISSA